MKIIFLDIDGVLNTMAKRLEYGKDFIDDNRVRILKRIVRDTNALIVLSSTWRKKLEDYNMVAAALNRHELYLYGQTPDHKVKLTQWVRRCEEINAWIQEFTARTYKAPTVVVLDDDPDAGKDGLESCFFHTDDERALTNGIADRIIGYLNAQEVQDL